MGGFGVGNGFCRLQGWMRGCGRKPTPRSLPCWPANGEAILIEFLTNLIFASLGQAKSICFSLTPALAMPCIVDISQDSSSSSVS